MTFFRIKKIKGNEYVYRVENEWGGKSSRQKVKGYLGRAFRPDLKNNLVFNEFCKISDIEKYFKNNTTEKIIKDLIEWEIAMHAIEKENSTFEIFVGARHPAFRRGNSQIFGGKFQYFGKDTAGE